MFSQTAILSDIIRLERALALAPANLERRRLAAVAEALRCCTSPLLARLRAIWTGWAATSCTPA